MLDGKSSETEIKVQILQLIKKTANPLIYRFNSILEDHYTKVQVLSELDLTYLIEYYAAARILMQTLETYIDRATQNGESTAMVTSEDFIIITHTSKLAEKSFRMCIGQTAMWLQ